MISVIVPIFNVEKYLLQCIDSIICQTYSDLEIILVDDGSTDSSGSICDDYTRKDSRIKVLHKKNGGIVSARKAGMSVSTGEYIGYIDGDDWIEPDMYEQMYKIMIAQDVDIIMCGRYEDIGNNSRKVYHGISEGKYEKSRLMSEVYPKMIVNDEFFEWGIFPGCWDKLFRRECIEKFQKSVDERIAMGEDAACVYPALLHVNSIYIMHECLYHYRQTAISMVKKVQNYEIEKEQFKILYNTVNSCFEKDKILFDLREQWLRYMVFLMIPRADSLYKDFDKLDYLFPFRNVRKGSDIILYGAGTYGQRLHDYLNKTGFCNVILWLDRNYKELQKMGFEVKDPDELNRSGCDTIVIANTYAKSRKALYQDLSEKYPSKIIHMIDEELVFSKNAVRAFGLLDIK